MCAVDPFSRVHEHESRHGAHDDGVPERSRRRDERLPHGVFRLRRRRHDGRAPEARFVRKEPPRDAVADRFAHARPDEPPDRRLPGKSAVEDEAERMGQAVNVHDEDRRASADVDERHERHEPLAPGRDRSDAAEDDDRGERHDNETGDPRRHGEGLLGHRRDRVRLDHVADAERGDAHEEGEDDTEPALLHAPLEDVHRTARHESFLVDDAVLDREHRLGVLRCDAEDARDPYPEHRARPARRDRRADADDVARSDGRGERRRQGAELADVPRALARAAEGEPDRLDDVPLDEPEPHGEEEVRSEEQNDHRRAPDRVAPRLEEFFDRFHRSSPP